MSRRSRRSVCNPRVAIDPYDVVEESRRQRVADSDQAVVDFSLRALEFSERGTRNLILPGLWPEPSTLKRVDVEEIDDVNIIQRHLQAGEEARPLRFEFLLAQACASRQQPVVRPGVIIGESAVGLNKAGRHRCSVSSTSSQAFERISTQRYHIGASVSSWSNLAR